MKLFVTGICGRLGRAVASLAQTRQIQIVGIDQCTWPVDKPMPENVDFHQGSFDDTAIIDRLMPGCDGLVNAAGLHGEYIATSTLEQFIHGNVTHVQWLCERAKKHGLKAVALSSTMEILLGRGGDPTRMKVFDESSPPNCDSIYSTSKLKMEELAPSIADHTGLSIACLRYMGFGYNSKPISGIGYLTKLLHSEDAASAAIAAATSQGLKGDVFNIAAGTPLTNKDIPQVLENPAAVLEHYFPGSVACLESLDVKVLPASLLPASRIQKADQILNWRPCWTFESWLRNHTRQPDGQTIKP